MRRTKACPIDWGWSRRSAPNVAGQLILVADDNPHFPYIVDRTDLPMLTGDGHQDRRRNRVYRCWLTLM